MASKKPEFSMLSSIGGLDMMWMSIDEILGKDIHVFHVLSCAVVLTDDVEHKEHIRTSDMVVLLWCDLIQVLCSYTLIM